jgi:hypothetical protein
MLAHTAGISRGGAEGGAEIDFPCRGPRRRGARRDTRSSRAARAAPPQSSRAARAARRRGICTSAKCRSLDSLRSLGMTDGASLARDDTWRARFARDDPRRAVLRASVFHSAPPRENRGATMPAHGRAGASAGPAGPAPRTEGLDGCNGLGGPSGSLRVARGPLDADPKRPWRSAATVSRPSVNDPPDPPDPCQPSVLDACVSA